MSGPLDVCYGYLVSKIFLLEFGVVQIGVISRFKIQKNNCNISTCSTIMKYN